VIKADSLALLLILSVNCLISMVLVGFFLESFIRLAEFYSILSLFRVFIMNGCLILSNTFSVSIEIIMLFFFIPLQ